VGGEGEKSRGGGGANCLMTNAAWKGGNCPAITFQRGKWTTGRGEKMKKVRKKAGSRKRAQGRANPSPEISGVFRGYLSTRTIISLVTLQEDKNQLRREGFGSNYDGRDKEVGE